MGLREMDLFLYVNDHAFLIRTNKISRLSANRFLYIAKCISKTLKKGLTTALPFNMCIHQYNFNKS